MMIMKKIFNSLFVIIASMVAFSACVKEENSPASETKTVEFFANSIETKTVFGESYTEGTDTKYPTLWTAGDKVKVYLNLSIPSGTSGTEKSQIVELLEGTETSASAKFKAEIVDYSPESYTFYAVSPSDAANARTSSRVTVVIPTLQKPLATSPAKNAQIVYAISETTEEMPSSIDMDFHHFTAYGKLSFSNLASTSVSKVKIVAPADVCLSGKWNYLPADGTLAPHSEGQSNEITIETTSTSDIWFACGPVDVSGKTLKFIVTTDDGNLEKEITFPANRKFQSGHVAKFTVDMDGVTAPEPEETTAYYQKVTSTQSDWSGKYLIVYEDGTEAYVFNATDAANGYLSATISNGTIASTSETDAVQVTIESMTGGYAIKTSKGYIYGASGSNKLSFNASEKQLNTISYSQNSIVITSGRVLQFNSASDQMRFRYYTSGGQKPIQLYKLVDGQSGGETPEPEPTSLISISVSGQKTEFVVGDTFEFGGTVTATYSNGSTALVTPTSVSTPQMSEGDHTVTVTYVEDEVTKTIEYTIHVSSASTGETQKYVKVTSNPADWSGTYLIVYESGTNAYVYNGTDSAAKNYVSATISNNEIEASSTVNAVAVQIAKTGTGYSIKVPNGKYISGGSSNGTTFNASAVANTITMNSNGTVKINNNTTTSFQFNSASDQMRFRYFKSSQKSVCLYKLTN